MNKRITSGSRKPRKFTCCNCHEERRLEYKGIEIGSGFFTEWYCRFCSRKLMSTYGTRENLNKAGEHRKFTDTNNYNEDSFWVKMANSLKKIGMEREGVL